jgi:hypothetical protein
MTDHDPKTDAPPDYAALITRYLKLRATADPKNNAPETERSSATKRMSSMEALHPGIGAMADIYVAIQTGTWKGSGSANQGAHRSQPRPTTATTQLPTFLSDLLKSVQPIATTFVRDLARDVAADTLDEARRMGNKVREHARSGVRDFVRRANPFDDDTEPDTEDRHMPKPRTSTRRPPASRRDLTALFKDVEIAGITEGGEDDDDSADALVCLAILIPVDVAEALIGSDSPKVESRIGKLLVDALVETVSKGESGEWPFDGDDETEDSADEPSAG